MKMQRAQCKQKCVRRGDHVLSVPRDLSTLPPPQLPIEQTDCEQPMTTGFQLTPSTSSPRQNSKSGNGY